MRKYALIIVTVILLQGCASLVDKGDDLYDAGLYGEAADFYQRALNKDPNDVEAKLGLDRARHQIIDQGLIEVRTLRLSLNTTAAAQKLEQILRDQQAWNLSLRGAVIATQAEETRYAKRWLLKEAEQLSSSRFPDQYQWFRYAYTHLIRNAQIERELTPFNKIVQQKGQTKCQTLTKDVKGQRFFLKAFVEQYCASWKQTPTLTIDNIDRARFNSLSLQNLVKHQSKHNNSQTKNLQSQLNQLKQGFQKHLWHSPLANKKMKLKINGDVSYHRNDKRVQRQTNYTVKKTVTTKDLNGNETTNSVDQKRIHRYVVTEHSENLSLDIRYTTQLRGQVLSVHLNENIHHATESHNERFSAANLRPKKAKFMNINSAFSKEVKELNQQFFDALNSRWEQAYCGPNSPGFALENRLRCGKINPSHDLVNHSMNTTFGIDYGSMVKLYGL